MKKTDGLDGLDRVIMKVETEQIGSCVGHTAIAEAVRTYISERLPQEKYPPVSEDGPSQDLIDYYEGWNAYRKSVREALGVDL